MSNIYEFSGQRKNPLSEAASLMGKKGGPAAAKVRFAKMTPEERKEHGRRLVNMRWQKERGEGAQKSNHEY